jgi:uncharacterized protein (TIGR03435 family)
MRNRLPLQGHLDRKLNLLLICMAALAMSSLFGATSTTKLKAQIPPTTPPGQTGKIMSDTDPSFEVATIKPNSSGAKRMRRLAIRGREFITRASSLGDLISFAYEVPRTQIVNSPGWLEEDRFDIVAVPEQTGEPDIAQVRLMLRKLLANRFKLTFHREKRNLSAEVLTVRKGGPKLTRTQSDGNLPGISTQPGPSGLTLSVTNATLEDFTGFLQNEVLDRPVIDKTGIQGRYDFQCTFTTDDSQFEGHAPKLRGQEIGTNTQTADPNNAAPSLYEALQEQLGLRLSTEKTMVDVIAIDRVEKPSEN